MKILLFISVFLIPFGLKAQNCVINTDGNTGKIIRSGTTEIIGDSSTVFARVAIMKIDSAYSFAVNTIININLSNIPARIVVKFSDSQSHSYTCVMQKLPGVSFILMNATISPVEVNYLSKNLISEISLFYGDQETGQAIIKVSPQNAGKILNSLNCLSIVNQN